MANDDWRDDSPAREPFEERVDRAFRYGEPLPSRRLERQQDENHARYLDHLRQKHPDVQPYTGENLGQGSALLLNACLQADGLATRCDVLTRVEGASHGGHPRYEPTLCVGTHSIGKEHKLALAFTGYVLGRLQHTPPLAGRLIAMDGTSHTMKLDPRATDLLPPLDALHAWTRDATPEPPPVILNKHCPLCPFQQSCQAQAEQEDNLSLLHSVTGRVLRQYEKKGIFTVKQLSGGSTLNRGHEHQRSIRRSSAREGRPRRFGGTQRDSGTRNDSSSCIVQQWSVIPAAIAGVICRV